MHVWKSISEWQERRRTLDGRSIGFVPTMGALHWGHASLVERCRSENDVAVVSIFVNPTQFNDPRDLDRYPHTFAADLELLNELRVDDVLAPATREIYPQGLRFRIEEDCVTEPMEGAFRPGFFTGVMTVVLKLLNLVRADRAYFGEKDYQQLQVIKEMARDFFLDTEIVSCPTVREDSGLAQSSRNRLLSEEARSQASWLFRALSEADSAENARAMIEAAGLSVDYVEEHWGRRFAAARLEGVRLIDNVPL